MKRQETVPGVGPIVALTTIAVFVEISRFESAKPATSYAGLVPIWFQVPFSQASVTLTATIGRAVSVAELKVRRTLT